MIQMIPSYLLSICNPTYRVLPTVPLWTTDMKAQCWWDLSTHCGKAKSRRWCVYSSRSSSLFFEPLTLILRTAGHLSPSVLLLAPILFKAQNSQLSCSAFYYVDSWSPCFLFRLNAAICVLEKYWQFSDLSYLLKAFPHSNAALFYWGKVCVLFNSECWVPRIACKINVNQV